MSAEIPELMSDADILALVNAEMSAAEQWGEELSGDREMALDYYYGRPLGDEEEGHSRVVTSDVADTIEWMMPDLVRTFASDEELIAFVSNKPDDTTAETATKLAHHVFFSENDGFRLIHDSIKDGLLTKTGALKWQWVTKKEPIDQDYRGLSEMEMAMLMQRLEQEAGEGAEVSILSQEVAQDGTYSIRVRVMRVYGKVEIEVVPPDELLIPRTAKVIDDSCRYVGHKIKTKTRSDLVAEGVPYETVIDLPKMTDDWSGDTVSRFNGSFGGDQPTQNTMMEVVEYYEHYVLADLDGDGIAERSLICTSGNEILRRETIASLPISVWSPVRMPHSAIGRSIADRIIDIQRINSALMRGTLDNIYAVNAGGRYEVVSGQVNMDDLLTMRPGGVIRTKAPGMLRPLPVEYIGDKTMQVMEMVRTMREERTGVNKHAQGLNAETMHQTAAGALAVMDQGKALGELIARLYAEFCLKPCFAGILDLTARYQDTRKQILVSGKALEIDPSAFREKYGLRVKVGSGNVRKSEKQASLLDVLQRQTLAMQAGSPLVDMGRIFNTLSDLEESRGLLSSRYWIDPASPEAQQAMAGKRERPDPLVEAEMVKAQSREKEAAARLELQGAKEAESATLKRLELASEEERAYTEMELKYSTNIPGAKI